jgi:hypothetical protein
VLVFAHAIVGRADLPIPVIWCAIASAVVLVVSFLGLAAGWSEPKLGRIPQRRLFRIPLLVEVLLGAIGVFVFVVVVYAGLAGVDSVQDNLAPKAVYVGFWIGVPFASLLFGDVFRLFSPWRAVGRATGWAARAVARGDSLPEPLPYPERLGRWPAAAGFFAFIVCELAWAAAKDPQPLAILMLVYVAIQFVGMSLYGVEAWTRRGDAFGVWFGLLASLAVFARDDDGRLVLRPPGIGATRVQITSGTTALLVIAIGSTAFDGAREGALFNTPIGDLQQTFVGWGTSLSLGLELAMVVFLLVSIAAVSAIWAIVVLGMPRRALRLSHVELAGRFAHTLIPIAAAYLVAHYFSALAYDGQSIWTLMSDPLGHGSDIFGAATRGVDYSIVSATQIWYIQVVALVIGHVTGLVLGHDRALQIYGSARAAIVSQIVMLVVMVMFTGLGIWLLSKALNQ